MSNIKSQTTEQLLSQRAALVTKINSNDGRLTAGSSMDLDHWQDQLEETASELLSRHRMTIDLANVPGTVLGNEWPDWPEWCKTFNERKAYQQGVAHARCIAFTHEPRQPHGALIPADPIVFFGGDRYLATPFTVSRNPKRTDADFHVHFANGYVHEKLSADGLEELARALIDAAHHLRTQPDF